MYLEISFYVSIVYTKMPKTEAQKKAQKKWIETHYESYREKQNGYAKKFYDNNREEILEKKRLYYTQKKLKQLQQEEPINEL